MVEKHVAKGMALTGKYMVAQGYWDESDMISIGDLRKFREDKKP
jgi:hypothetical protein